MQLTHSTRPPLLDTVHIPMKGTTTCITSAIATTSTIITSCSTSTVITTTSTIINSSTTTPSDLNITPMINMPQQFSLCRSDFPKSPNLLHHGHSTSLHICAQYLHVIARESIHKLLQHSKDTLGSGQHYIYYIYIYIYIHMYILLV